jgi:CRP-like cAMP-binding protein
MQLHGREVHNRLLLSMPPAVLERLRPELRPVTLLLGQVICRVNDEIEYVYFPNVGFVSLIKTMEDGRSVEVGGVGVEGVTSPSSLFGINEAVLEAIVQVAGEGFRIRRDILRSEMDRDTGLRGVLEAYTHHLLSDIGQTAACNRLHSVEERCCRWLLIAEDNARAGRFALTHEFLAMMLGVQRSGVSLALRSLKRAGLIDYERGVIDILDRQGLEETACECYRTSRRDLDRSFSTLACDVSRRRRDQVS